MGMYVSNPSVKWQHLDSWLIALPTPSYDSAETVESTPLWDVLRYMCRRADFEEYIAPMSSSGR